MQETNIIFPKDFYLSHLTIIGEIKFTQREMEIIAFFINGRSSKKIACFLAISLRTVEFHTRNITLKLGCNSREGVINFIEKSGKIFLIRKYYSIILLYNEFEKSLRAIAALHQHKIFSSVLIYQQKTEEDHEDHKLPYYLKTLLGMAGVKAAVKFQEKHQELVQLLNAPHKAKHVLYLLSETWEAEFKNFIKECGAVPCFFERSLFLLEKPGKKLADEFKKLPFIDISPEKNYYFLIFEILQKIFQNIDFAKTIEQFKNQYDSLQELPLVNYFGFKEDKKELKENSLIYKRLPFKKSKKSTFLHLSCVFGIFCGGFLIIYKLQGFLQEDLRLQSNNSIESDFFLPKGDLLLERSNLTFQINEKLKGQNGIQTVALFGLGGAGKTTLARQYAKSQKASVIWEINAETVSTLVASFERLAYALAKTEEEKRTLKEIQGIPDSTEREEKLCQFVKDQLKLKKKWVLIYDNIEKFSEIQKYFPRNPQVWGEGKVIITTRDSNIPKSVYIQHAVLVEELNPEQKLTLFTQIINHGEQYPLVRAQLKEAKAFLNQIPPFPLDISTAAFYIKTSNISYKQYLERLKKYEPDFLNVEEDLLKKLNDYTKTRYNIILLSVKELLNTHKDFADLLLLISLIDSQNIPRNILDGHKKGVIVDKFIYCLKKYSLILDERPPTPPLEATFSLHRVTQAIILTYLTKKLGLEKRKEHLQPLIHTLEEQAANTMEKSNSPLLSLFQLHCEAFLSHKKLLTPSMQGSIEAELGRTYLFFGNYIKAKQFLEKGHATLKMVASPNYSKVLTYMGILYRVLGDYEKAISFLNESIALTKESSVEKSQNVAMTLTFLGEALRESGKYEKAKNSLHESLSIYNTFYSNIKDDGIPRASAHLGVVYRDMGNYEQARVFLEKGHMLFKEQLSDIGMAMTLTFLGDVYRALGDLKKAETLLEQSLMIYKQHFSESHLTLSRVRGYLGCVYGELGKFKKAKILLTKSHEVYRKHFGEKHIAPARFLRHLGKVYFLEGNIEIAEGIMKEVLSIFSEANHPEAYIALEILADLNIEKDFKLKEEETSKDERPFKILACKYLNQALQLVKTHFPPDSSHIARIQAKLLKLTKDKKNEL